MNSLFPTKLLIATGPNHKDVGCTENVDVEVDLVPPGEPPWSRKHDRGEADR